MDDVVVPDRLTDLPNEIIHQILTLLPTKSVVISSSLSQKWKQISYDHLKHTNNLDFGEDFSKGKNPDEVSDSLNRLLRTHEADKIDHFRLVFSPRNERHKSNAYSWIEYAVLRSVSELDMDFCRHIQHHFLSRAHVVCRNEAFEVPGSVFQSETVRKLSLRRCILTVPETYSGFRHLQTLCLKEVHVTDVMIDSLLSNCGSLEVLILKECGSLSRVRVVGSSKLRKLTVYECLNVLSIEIRGIMIRSLLVSSGHLEHCKIDGLDELQEVFVGTRGDEFGGVLNVFIEAWIHISHVRVLFLYLGHLVPFLIKDLQVNFSNLQELHLVNSPLFGLFDTDVYCFFTHFTCPSLQKIHIQLSTVSEEDNFVWEHRKPTVIKPINRSFNSLKTIEMRNFRGSSSDTELAAYFLERSPALRTLVLIPPTNLRACPGTYDSVLEKLGKVVALSSAVEIRVGDGKVDGLMSFLKWHHVSDVYHK